MTSLGVPPTTVSQAVSTAAQFLRDEVFSGRRVRIGFSEKRYSELLGPRLEAAYVFPEDATRNAHNYPLSVAGWALAEGRIIEWPDENSAPCDFDRLVQLGKLADLSRLVEEDRFINAPPYLARTTEVRKLRDSFNKRALLLSDFFQDWASWAPAMRYRRFISVPVPIVDLSSGESVRPERGVFNIDSLDTARLLDPSIRKSFALVSDYVERAYESRVETR